MDISKNQYRSTGGQPSWNRVKYLQKILSESAAYKSSNSPDPTTNSENMNPNFHIFFDQIEQVLLVLLVYLLSFVSSEIG